MATFDPSIWNAVPQPQSFIDVARDLGGLRDARQRRQQNALLMDRQTEDRGRENALLQFERGLGGTAPEQLPDAYQQAGYVGRAEELRSKQSDRRRQAAARAVDEQRATEGKRQFLMQGLAGITDRETAKQHLADGVQSGVYNMKEATRLMQDVPTDPAQFARWRDTLTQGGNVVADNERAATKDAAQIAHWKELERLRGIEVAKPRAGAGGGDIRTQLFEGPEGQRVVTMEGDNVGRSVPVLDEQGRPIMGKRGQSVAQKAQNAKDLEALAGEAEKLVPGATGSGIGAGIDFLVGPATVGASTPGSRALASLRILQGKMLALTERMEGPQSDADRRVYEQAVGDLSNRFTPAGDKLAAIATIREMNQKYFGRRGLPELPTPRARGPGLTDTPLVPAGSRDIGGGFRVEQ